MTLQFSISMPPTPNEMYIHIGVSFKTQRSINWSTTYNFYRTTQNWISFYMSTYKKYALSKDSCRLPYTSQVWSALPTPHISVELGGRIRNLDLGRWLPYESCRYFHMYTFYNASILIYFLIKFCCVTNL